MFSLVISLHTHTHTHTNTHTHTHTHTHTNRASWHTRPQAERPGHPDARPGCRGHLPPHVSWTHHTLTNSRSNVSPADCLDSGQTMFCRTGVELPDRHLGSSSRHLNQPPPLYPEPGEFSAFNGPEEAGNTHTHTHTHIHTHTHTETSSTFHTALHKNRCPYVHACTYTCDICTCTLMHACKWYTHIHVHTHAHAHTHSFHISQAGFPDTSCGDNHVYCAVCKLNSVPNSHTRHHASQRHLKVCVCVCPSVRVRENVGSHWHSGCSGRLISLCMGVCVCVCVYTCAET